ncbi:MAG TPA: alpha/beta hydrolase [Rhodanobacteraceae bacterium]|nr:alpha/beta hydrolase [Rhodanobacteraceae bacterium]
MSMNLYSGLRLTAIAAMAGMLGWQFHDVGTRAAAAPAVMAAPAVAASSATPKTADAPRHWQLGSLTLTACELDARNSGARTAAWCKDFDVPENPAKPDGRHIKLKLAVIKSDAGDAADKDMVLLLAGGPGEAATQSFVNTSWYADLLKHHHVVLLDQRGTGGSNPLTCKNTEQAAEQEQDDSVSPDYAKMREWVGKCLTEVEQKADPRYYTTTIAADDIEAVRKALGSPQFDILGVSYGTRMAQQYLKHYPDGVRAVVLDSPVPNQLVLGSSFAQTLESALKQQFANCTATPACKQRFGDPMQTLYQLRDALAANPHKVSFRDPETFDSTERMLSAPALASLVRMYAYAPETAALLPLSIDAAAHGDVGPLLGQVKLLTGDLSGDMNGGMSMSVICSEDADLLKENPADANTILGNTLVKSIQAQCAVWPHGERPADFHAPLKSDKPILILSGELDPVTPPAFGKEILAGLSNGRQLIAKGQGHAVMVRGCMPTLIAQFFDKINPKGLDASCLDRLGPTPAFINFNGAAP